MAAAVDAQPAHPTDQGAVNPDALQVSAAVQLDTIGRLVFIPPRDRFPDLGAHVVSVALHQSGPRRLQPFVAPLADERIFPHHIPEPVQPRRPVLGQRRILWGRSSSDNAQSVNVQQAVVCGQEMIGQAVEF